MDKIVLAAAALMALAAVSAARACDMTIAIIGAKGSATIYGQVFADAAHFPKPDGGIATFELVPGSTTTAMVKGLASGRYAVAAFQDTNGNGKLDKNFLGAPQEPYGFSRNAVGTLGPPPFDQAAIDCGAQPVATTIHLH